MAGELAYIKENEQNLQKMNDYYTDDLVPNLENKFEELKKKIENMEKDKQSLIEDLQNIKDARQETQTSEMINLQKTLEET